MLYLDTAVATDVAELLDTGLFQGVTSNPGILHQAGLTFADIPDVYATATGHGAQLVFAQTLGTDPHTLRASAEQILALGDRARVKIMCTQPGLTVARQLADEGHDVLVTGVVHPAQILAAQAAGAWGVAVYVGRAAKLGTPPQRLIGDAMAAMCTPGSLAPLRIVAASLHDLDECADATAAGAVDLTVPTSVARQLLNEQHTMEAAEAFEAL